MSFNEVNQSTAELTQIAGSTLTSVYADAPIGAISAYGGDVAPTGWLLCNGAAISRTTYAELYAVIGTKFGSGDGSTTFNLPDGSISASVYPVEGVGKYIIKAVQTSVPADFETALALKQDIADNTLETTDKTIPGAINELNTDLSEFIKIKEFALTQSASAIEWGNNYYQDIDISEYIDTGYSVASATLSSMTLGGVTGIAFQSYNNSIRLIDSADFTGKTIRCQIVLVKSL